MFEHSSIRVVFREKKTDVSVDFFRGFNDYLVNDHVAVEEKILFPGYRLIINLLKLLRTILSGGMNLAMRIFIKGGCRIFSGY